MAWKKIHGFNNYSVSDDGQVRNDTTMYILKHHLNNKGYPMVYLCRENKGHWRLVHRLVAIAFIPNPEGKPCINHIDGNTQNYSIDNLEWCTLSENQLHRSRVLKKVRFPEEALQATRQAVICIETGNVYISINEAARVCGLHQANISKVLDSSTRTTGGYHWRRYCNGR